MYVGVERGYNRPRKSWYRKDVPILIRYVFVGICRHIRGV